MGPPYVISTMGPTLNPPPPGVSTFTVVVGQDPYSITSIVASSSSTNTYGLGPGGPRNPGGTTVIIGVGSFNPSVLFLTEPNANIYFGAGPGGGDQIGGSSFTAGWSQMVNRALGR
jgi:hypothetical protein